MGQLLLRCFCFYGMVWALLTGTAQAQTQTAPPPASSNASVFVTAHQDDWQLFMGSRAYDNVQRHRKVVFIIITAGQGDQPSDAFWKAREQGCLNSARTACDLTAGKLPPPVMTKVTIRGHALQASYYRNTVVYFLRLPDGGGRGQGFSFCNFQTLAKLRAGQGGPLKTLDGSTQYESWADLTSTVRDIIRRETRPSWTLWVHSPNPDARANPNDHADHMSAGIIAGAATQGLDCRRLLYSGYDVRNRAVNLNAAQTANQTALFAAYCQAMTERSQPSGWQPDHLCWLGRQYSVLVHSAASASTTAATAAQLRNDSLLKAPSQIILGVPAPNPCTASSVLSYELPTAADVNLGLYDMQGRLIRTLVQAQQQAGHYEVWLDVNQFPATGVYLCRLQAGSVLRTQRVQIEH
ncbi:PIG-L family deacetylase [Hymenobacter sp. 15J16-1T3B]|uniref:PIG-L family deacetylase n=1 Tax=Hymenobacter sp. 15J16-1T3B TaxID=2886941 RepID=UPI001D130513|nr:PIG-L family deacetylase [Hymenobacter sp. 15J16-1T3B]MCC3155940.1 PIG-L family deacetylase [Hymenobacter sp. 15J16-1T3B]